LTIEVGRFQHSTEEACTLFMADTVDTLRNGTIEAPQGHLTMPALVNKLSAEWQIGLAAKHPLLFGQC